MAKITVQFDTVEKTMAVTIDGKSVENVTDVNFYKSMYDEGECRCSLVTMSEDSDNDMRQYTQLVASETHEAKQLGDKAIASAFDGFVETPVERHGKVADDIVEFLGRK